MSNLNREQCPLEKGFNINKEFCKVTGFFLTTAHVKSVFRSCFLCWYLYSQLNIPFKVTKSSHPILLLYRAIATIYWALETAFLSAARAWLSDILYLLLLREAPRVEVVPCVGRPDLLCHWFLGCRGEAEHTPALGTFACPQDEFCSYRAFFLSLLLTCLFWWSIFLLRKATTFSEPFLAVASVHTASLALR